MATKVIKNLQLLRNSGLTSSHDDAVKNLKSKASELEDGSIVLNRYNSSNGVKTIAAIVYKNGSNSASTIFDLEEIDKKISSASGDSNTKYTELKSKLGDGVTSANTVTSQLAKLSGSTDDTSGSTSVAGAKKYADTLVTSAKTDLTITVATSGETNDILKSYTISQGNNKIVKIDIPKDLVVSGGSVVYGKWEDEKFTENGTSGVTDDKDTALKLVIANQEKPVYINTKSLVDIYSGTSGVAVDGYNISAKIDTNGNEFLTVGANGLKVTGVTSAINNKISSISGETTITDGKVITKISQSSGKVSVETASLTADKVSSSAISSDTTVAVTSTTVQGAISDLATAIKTTQNNAISVANGNGITITGESTNKTISVKASSNGGLKSDTDGVAVKLADNSGLKSDESGLTIDLSSFIIDCGEY